MLEKCPSGFISELLKLTSDIHTQQTQISRKLSIIDAIKSAAERPNPDLAVSFVSGKEVEILRYATGLDSEELVEEYYFLVS